MEVQEPTVTTDLESFHLFGHKNSVCRRGFIYRLSLSWKVVFPLNRIAR